MRGTLELRTEILRAHQQVADGVQGARSKLERLQAEYRSSGHLIERPGGSATLIEPRPVTSLRPRPVKQQAQRKTRRAISRAQDTPPYWQLGNDGSESWRLR